MKAIKFSFFALVILTGQTFYSCVTEDFKSKETVLDLPAQPFSYFMGAKDELPTLGRVLFYDPRLSANNSVSCSSCHKQALAFSDNRRFSLGFQNKFTLRNSMPIQNIVSGMFNPGGGGIDSTSLQPTALFWDGRQHDLQTMVMEPIQNHIEMGVNDLNQLAGKVASISQYQPLFTAAFDGGQITPDNIAIALSAFLVSIRSNQSRFDASLLGSGELTTLEVFGKDLFFDKYNCNSCHQLQQPFNGYQLAGEGGLADIGLDKNPQDEGAFRSTGNSSDKGKFKIPSLRNIALTAPYMHDGRFNTLQEVIDHYSTEIETSENLDDRLRDANGSARKFNISDSESKAMIAFLNSMTDPHMVGDLKFSNPFRLK